MYPYESLLNTGVLMVPELFTKRFPNFLGAYRSPSSGLPWAELLRDKLQL